MNWQEVVKSAGSNWAQGETHWALPVRTDEVCRQESPLATSIRYAIDTQKKITHYWTKEDDTKLVKLVGKHGLDWERIVEKFEDKSSSQLSSRWKNRLDPKLKKVSWSDEEETVLKMLVLQFGYDWDKLSKYLQGRSPSEIKKRFFEVVHLRLSREEISVLDEKNKLGMEEEEIVALDYKSQGNQNEVLLALNKKVEDLNCFMRNTIDQIQKLEINVLENRTLFTNN